MRLAGAKVFSKALESDLAQIEELLNAKLCFQGHFYCLPSSFVKRSILGKKVDLDRKSHLDQTLNCPIVSLDKYIEYV